jgi:hypothetical protein
MPFCKGGRLSLHEQECLLADNKGFVESVEFEMTARPVLWEVMLIISRNLN